jgi:hypothetical protein
MRSGRANITARRSTARRRKDGRYDRHGAGDAAIQSGMPQRRERRRPERVDDAALAVGMLRARAGVDRGSRGAVQWI